MRGGVNKGIYLTGGEIHAQNVAVGTRARAGDMVRHAGAVLEQAGLDDLAERLLAVERALVERAEDLERPEEVRDALVQVAAELRQDRPNKLTVLGLLGGIAAGVQSVAELASAVEALVQIVQRLP